MSERKRHAETHSSLDAIQDAVIDYVEQNGSAVDERDLISFLRLQAESLPHGTLSVPHLCASLNVRLRQLAPGESGVSPEYQRYVRALATMRGVAANGHALVATQQHSVE